ncbi:uncharacterized protein Z518_07539 [Rhinocladiella mackenziei CBS 650.93]|uniref:Rhinocladiella mackenziei CBS 650.93 unplaced genomic scaffold supercont1.5, whole genome shotgun sequence n=1 Tax=Rhinocladiella mackenziei CBS 650.93 TaxID=1442369 RepID=A0A0D2ILA9_9EURO|nr:uncharacterized protein Z518_07539 [Rhinocladiella mackenziei CBS 650.93]KIX03986.1 hypothetical protein Z518_07539 [Rhinocladiella mackenziei CBS 650.93]
MASQTPLVIHAHPPLLGMPSQTSLDSLAGALGSIIGYLGAEAAEPYLFERLLWPQRFYNSNSLSNLLVSAFLMPMGGPLHRAALGTLDRFRRKGLYRGSQRGHMLGTAFYPDTGLRFKLHGYDGADLDTEVRNGLWVNVLRRLRNYNLEDRSSSGGKVDEEEQVSKVRRAVQMVHHLHLSVSNVGQSSPERARAFCEDSISLATPFVMIASETTAVACALLILLAEQRYFWFAALMCMPLALKLASLVCCVRREPATPSIRASDGAELLVEIDDYDHGFPLISGPEEVVRQFFRHWGHPVRTDRWDRVRELMSMTLIFGFVFCFPVGLLSLLWVNPTIQIVWLAYQMYVIAVMHLNRLIGFEGPGRLEDRLAHELAKKGSVCLYSKNGGTLQANLTSIPVSRIREGREVVEKIASQHSKKLAELKRSSSDVSESSTLCDQPETTISPVSEKNIN